MRHAVGNLAHQTMNMMALRSLGNLGSAEILSYRSALGVGSKALYERVCACHSAA